MGDYAKPEIGCPARPDPWHVRQYFNFHGTIKKTYGKHLATLLVLITFTAGNAYAFNYSIQTSDPNVSHKTWFTFQAKAGEEIQDYFTISNKDQSELTVSILPLDASLNIKTGGFHPTENISTQTGIGKWTSLDLKSADIKPYSTQDVDFSIKIPEDAKPGIYYGAILVSPNQSIKLNQGSTVETRLGARIYLTVLPGKSPFNFLYIYIALTIVIITGIIMYLKALKQIHAP